MLMDLDVVMKSADCNFIVQFYGAIFKEGDCWICMELMDCSLDKFYHFIFDELNESIPEQIIGKITVATVHALNYLKEKFFPPEYLIFFVGRCSFWQIYSATAT